MSVGANGKSVGGVEIKVSRIAIASSVCAVVGAVLFLPGLIAWLDPRILYPRSAVAVWTGQASVLAIGCALLLGISGLLDIATSGGRRTGYGFGAIGVAAPFLFVIGLICVPIFAGVKHSGFRPSCGTNLSSIGKAMLIYANDHQDELPLAGGRDTTWGPGLSNWTAASRSEAFGLDPNGTGGQATISSSLCLLVRYGGVAPKTFVCKADRGTRPFDPNRLPAAHRDLTALWDFGPDPARHCSYSYHMSYGPYRLTTSYAPDAPVAADHDPWMDGPRRKASDFPKFRWDGSVKQQRAGNSVPHWLDGQNVLFLDSHVEFAKRAYCGLDNDNIYTISANSTAGDPLGTPTRLGSQPANRRDSVLVNDPPQVGQQAPGTSQ
ncbi:MAG: hypothetical protein JW955_02930 [Sedimentisphaerales bacterium]|nr:hypothetical protein [Sedimentisphaerales bacterium]